MTSSSGLASRAWRRDVVSTGTPAGVGYFRKPPVYLAPGDEVTVSVDRIGELTNPVVAGWRPG
jgi:2-keto-4-pentenoate hydratase/2-oxohepta-3-ene-1,7-dioic acid hydratase in catechol pathway